jgi:mono/diheme cytochrome c family protein
MLPALMRRPLVMLALPALAVLVVACGSQGIQLAKSSPDYSAAEIFTQHCGACHTLKVAGTEGSSVHPQTREYKDGPNFDQRKEEYQQILYAIRNGGFSSGPMPQNILVGQDADKVAQFIAKYSGRARKTPPTP